MSFDVITVGGGLAGSTLATELARAGHKILVLEREPRFKDRVRGENMLPWGVAAARRLGSSTTGSVALTQKLIFDIQDAVCSKDL